MDLRSTRRICLLTTEIITQISLLFVLTNMQKRFDCTQLLSRKKQENE